MVLARANISSVPRGDHCDSTYCSHDHLLVVGMSNGKCFFVSDVTLLQHETFGRPSPIVSRLRLFANFPVEPNAQVIFYRLLLASNEASISMVENIARIERTFNGLSEPFVNWHR